MLASSGSWPMETKMNSALTLKYVSIISKWSCVNVFAYQTIEIKVPKTNITANPL